MGIEKVIVRMKIETLVQEEIDAGAIQLADENSWVW